MGKIRVVARVAIHEGKLDAFKALVERAVGLARLTSEGTLGYEWYLSADEKTCTVLETYASSEAVLAHLANARVLFRDLSQACTASVELFGEPSEELERAIAMLKPVIHRSKIGGVDPTAAS